MCTFCSALRLKSVVYTGITEVCCNRPDKARDYGLALQARVTSTSSQWPISIMTLSLTTDPKALLLQLSNRSCWRAS
eukprot:1158745-Pelagomonas_calceolata.AAC.6